MLAPTFDANLLGLKCMKELYTLDHDFCELQANDNVSCEIFENGINEAFISFYVNNDSMPRKNRLCTLHPSSHALLGWIVHGGGLTEPLDGQIDILNEALLTLCTYIGKLYLNDHDVVEMFEICSKGECGIFYSHNRILSIKNNLHITHSPSHEFGRDMIVDCWDIFI